MASSVTPLPPSMKPPIKPIYHGLLLLLAAWAAKMVRVESRKIRNVFFIGAPVFEVVGFLKMESRTNN
jgi:hypothetical protein